eukprot:TRINITY_DN682_c1_g3_i1.p1 TRINITY_DN682_c1_g3~~TRINITY_DN682_c1_g3_i1.p1  ORF type:complete len:689 (+),score=221.78 TRINITY_DN682_c1_g3_i1:65-2131(+)
MASHRVYVGGLATNTDEDSLTKLFSKFGQVQDVQVIRASNGLCKGLSFVTLYCDDIRSCIGTLNKSRWNKRVIKVELAQTSNLDKLNRERQEEEKKQQWMDRKQKAEQEQRERIEANPKKWYPSQPSSWLNIKGRHIPMLNIKKDDTIIKVKPTSKNITILASSSSSGEIDYSAISSESSIEPPKKRRKVEKHKKKKDKSSKRDKKKRRSSKKSMSKKRERRRSKKQDAIEEQTRKLLELQKMLEEQQKMIANLNQSASTTTTSSEESSSESEVPKKKKSKSKKKKRKKKIEKSSSSESSDNMDISESYQPEIHNKPLENKEEYDEAYNEEYDEEYNEEYDEEYDEEYYIEHDEDKGNEDAEMNEANMKRLNAIRMKQNIAPKVKISDETTKSTLLVSDSSSEEETKSKKFFDWSSSDSEERELDFSFRAAFEGPQGEKLRKMEKGFGDDRFKLDDRFAEEDYPKVVPEPQDMNFGVAWSAPKRFDPSNPDQYVRGDVKKVKEIIENTKDYQVQTEAKPVGKIETRTSDWFALMGDSGESDEENSEYEEVIEEKGLSFKLFPDRKYEQVDNFVQMEEESSSNEEDYEPLTFDKPIIMDVTDINTAITSVFFPFLKQNWFEDLDGKAEDLIDGKNNTIIEESILSPGALFMRTKSLKEVENEWREEKSGLTRFFKRRNRAALKRKRSQF